MPKFFDNSMHIVYPAYFKSRHDFRFYRSIVKKEISMIDEVEKLLKIPCLLYEKVSKDYRLTQYLESNIGKKFFKPDREVLIEVFDLKKDGHLLKSRKMLNQYLKEYGFKYHINDGKEKRKAYWVIEKSSLM